MNVQGYYPSPGEGVYNPIRTSPLKTWIGNLPPKTSAMLYKKSKRKPAAYASAIKSHGPLNIKPSYFSQYGRGRIVDGSTDRQTAINRLRISAMKRI